MIGEKRAKMAQVYTKELVEAILRGLKREMEKSNYINAFEEMLMDPLLTMLWSGML